MQKIAYRIIPGKKVLVKGNWYFFTRRWLIVVTRQHVSDVVKIILPWFILIGITPNAAEEGAENTNQVHCSAKPCKSLEQATGNQVSMLTLYYNHFEITGYPCNLIGSQHPQCDLFPNHTIFCSKSHLFLANENKTVKQNNHALRFEGFFKLSNYIAGKWKAKRPLFGKFGSFCCYSSSCIQAIKLCDFKMDIIK